MKKNLIRIAAAVTVLAFATPVLACSDAKTTTASNEKNDSGKKQTASAAKASDSTAVKTATASK
jgi:hypothetical protein